MTSRRRHQQQRNRFKPSSLPKPSDIITNTSPHMSLSAESTSPLCQPVTERANVDPQRRHSVAIEASQLTQIENTNDRFVHEKVPPTAHSVLRTQPAFIGKLYKMLEDDTQNLICWSSNGEYFSVFNSALFSKQILPQYFKHNNWQSFVRQLNMYGFSKINEMIHSNISFENQTWDFKHPHFKRGDFHSMVLVKRKSARSAPGSAPVHLNSAGPLPSTSPRLLHYQNHVNTVGKIATHNETSVDGPSSSQQNSSHSELYDIEDDVGVENRVMQLDQQVIQVSQSVTRLTTEMQDIKSLICNQQAMIHDLASVLRSCHDKVEFSSTNTRAASVTTASTSSSCVEPDDIAHQITSLPSIHSLANNLRHAANIDTSEPPHSHHRLSFPYSYTSMHETPQSFQPYPQPTSYPSFHTSPTTSPTSSCKSLPIHHDNHHSHHHHHQYHPPPDDSHPQRRRSSHPASNNFQSPSSHPLYPLLNTTIERNNPY